LREVIDIREMKEVNLILPYYSSTNYLDMTEAMGRLTITVLSELRAPESVYGGVQMMMFWRAGEDMEFQVPCASYYKGPYSTQAGDGTEEITHVIGGDPTHEMRTDFMEQSIGECFTSIKQVLTRYARMNSTLIPTNAGAGSVYTLWPYYTNVTRSLAGTGVLIDGAIGGDAYCLYSPLFAFYRGSMRVRTYTSGGNYNEYYLDSIRPFVTPRCLDTRTAGSYNYAFGSGSTWPTPATYVPYTLGENLVTTTNFPCFSVPYASRYHCSLVAPQTGATTLAFNPIPITGTRIEASQSLQLLCFPSYTIQPSYRAVGDDFQFFVSWVWYHDW